MRVRAHLLAALAACSSLGCTALITALGESFDDYERILLVSTEPAGKSWLSWTVDLYPEMAAYLKEHGDPEYFFYEDRETPETYSTLYHFIYVEDDRIATWEQFDTVFNRKGVFREADELPPWTIGLLKARERELLLAERAARAERALAAAEPETSYASGYARRLAIVIGIDAYVDFPDVEGGAGDARAVASALRRRGFDRIVELYDGDATRERILATLAAQSPLDVGAEDLLLIYFAGHGATEVLPEAGMRGYIAPADARRGALAQSAISMQTLREVSGRLPAKHVLYALDSCFSGLGLVRAAPRMRPQNYYQKMTSLRAVQIATAGREGEKALEQDGRGVFTLFLLRALQGEADADRDGFVTGSELGAYLPARVSDFTQGRQTPRYGTLLGSGDVAFDVPR